MIARSEATGLVVRSVEPLNAETPLDTLVRDEVTPTELFFVRNHGAVPAVDPTAYRLAVGGLVETTLSLSLADLEGLGEPVSVAATLVCAGNRRAELQAHRAIPHEMPWDAGVVGHAKWRGVRLRDVLRETGIRAGARHVAFGGLDEAEAEGARTRFGSSIPLEKALAPEVVLAWGMNGETLSPEHGFPLRLIVPGYIGARSVKWLGEVTVQERPSSNYFQARGYRLYPADGDGPSIELGETTLTSAVCRVEAGTAGTLVVEGYALAGGMRTVERVEVSADGGETWQKATFRGDAKPGSWRLWRAQLETAGPEREVVARAWDSAASSQPPAVASVWNPRGYMNNAWHRRRLAPGETWA